MKSQIPINLAYEDILSEAVLLRILQNYPNYIVGTRFTHYGCGYLRKKVLAFNNAAKAMPLLLLTDLDNTICPSQLINEWLDNTVRHPNLLFRIAVREIEAWLLADRENISKFLSISPLLLKMPIEDILDPKEFLIDISKKSNKRYIREAIVPESGSTAKIGKSYNDCLSIFVNQYWDIAEARIHSQSLNKALNALENFKPVWSKLD
jgi:hypothetical protein